MTCHTCQLSAMYSPHGTYKVRFKNPDLSRLPLTFGRLGHDGRYRQSRRVLFGNRRLYCGNFCRNVCHWSIEVVFILEGEYIASDS